MKRSVIRSDLFFSLPLVRIVQQPEYYNISHQGLEKPNKRKDSMFRRGTKEMRGTPMCAQKASDLRQSPPTEKILLKLRTGTESHQQQFCSKMPGAFVLMEMILSGPKTTTRISPFTFYTCNLEQLSILLPFVFYCLCSDQKEHTITGTYSTLMTLRYS